MTVFVSPYNPVQQAGCRAKNPPDLIIASRAPSTSIDINYFPGTLWLFLDTGAYIMIGKTNPNAAIWMALNTTGGAISTINGQAPVAANYSILGTAGQITATAIAGSNTLSIPDPFVAPGSITATTSLTATLGAITATNGNLVLGTAGNKITIATGANSSTGTSGALVAGAGTVLTSAVTANSKVFFSTHALGTVTVPQSYYVSARTPGVSFAIASSSASDTSTVDWWLIN
jgi:tartrate dehydratase beta subunit/fumarate hydratase class I family protein